MCAGKTDRWIELNVKLDEGRDSRRARAKVVHVCNLTVTHDDRLDAVAFAIRQFAVHELIIALAEHSPGVPAEETCNREGHDWIGQGDMELRREHDRSEHADIRDDVAE